ncbi:hypothetical protein ACN47E_006948 [Coniothyrium glycines]
MLPSERDCTSDLPSLRATIKLAEGDLAQHIYDVKFYPYTLPGVDPVFAVCGDNFIIVCRCLLDKRNAFENLLELRYEKDSVRDRDGYNNSLAWSQAENGDPLLCVAGTPQIRVYNITTQKLETTIIGHGGSILDLAISPIDPTILASCGSDYSVRIWSLNLPHQKQPLAAICYGQGHKDQVLALAWHRNGRFLLSAGMDTSINLWTMPDDFRDHAGTDKPAMIHYPHFSTTELHTDFIDSLQWYNDIILSHACREDQIILWRIDNFSSDRSHIPPAPVPTSNAIISSTPVIVPASSISTTRSAWGGRLQRLIHLDLPASQVWYNRFSLYHQLGHHPVVVSGNDRSKVFFWDLQRLEMSHTGEDSAESNESKTASSILPRHLREASSASTASSSAASVGVATVTKKKAKKVKEKVPDQGISNPFNLIKAHKVIEIPKYSTFAFHQFAWSTDGQWCVGVGDTGLVNIFHRWEDGVPRLSKESDTTRFSEP